MFQAKDLMNPGTPSIAFDQTVAEAIHFFKTHSSGFVTVKAADDRYQGVLTEGNLVRVFLKSQAQPEKEALIFYRDCFEPMQLIHQDEEFAEIVKKIMTAVGNRVFVIDNQGVIVGHITAKDILPAFTFSAKSEGSDKKPLNSKGDVSSSSREPGAQLDSMKSELYLYESFFEKSPFMMHSVNPKGVIQMANEILHTLLGYAYGELIGKTIFDLYPKENHKKAEAGIQTILNHGFHKVIQAQMIAKDGQTIEVEMASRALTDPSGKSVGTITVSRPLNMDQLLAAL